MIIGVILALYFLTGFIFAILTRSMMLDRSIERYLAKLEYDNEHYPYANSKERKFTEKQKLEWAIKESNKYDDLDRDMITALTVLFWVFITPVFFAKRGIEYISSRKFKLFTLSKYENRLKELDQIEVLKKQALEDKKKYEAAVKLLKAEGINVGE